jgi:hypothetical protein
VLVFALGNECSDIEPPPFFGDNEADLRACAAAGFDEFWPTPPSIVVDGLAVPDITRYRTQTPVFGYFRPTTSSARPLGRRRRRRFPTGSP